MPKIHKFSKKQKPKTKEEKERDEWRYYTDKKIQGFMMDMETLI